MFELFLGSVCLLFNSYLSKLAHENKCHRMNNTTVTCDVIPETLPEGTGSVLLNLQPAGTLFLNSSFFVSRGWDTVTQLEFRVNGKGTIVLQDYCFYGLKDLQILRIKASCYIHFDPESLAHLDSVQILDLSGSVRLSRDEVMNALGGNNKLPLLTSLIMSNCCVYRTSFKFDDKVFQKLQRSKLTHLDISGLQLSDFNVTAMAKRLQYLDTLNISHATLNRFYSDGIVRGDIRGIKSVDFSFVTLPKKTLFYLPGKMRIDNLTFFLSSMIHMDAMSVLTSPEIVNISGLVPDMTSYWIWNSKLHIDKNPDTLTKTLVVRKNNFRRLDLSFICENYNFSSFKEIDLSENEMEFIHPDILSCLPNIQKINLSKNLLLKMAKENLSLFEVLFINLKFLKHIDLSNNHLTHIPAAIFKKNELLEKIDLSYNKLEQVHFALTQLKNLRVLNLEGNDIKTLDHKSIRNLNEFTRMEESTDQGDVSVILKSNPLDCSKCESKAFYVWLTSTHLFDTSSQELVCSNENGVKVNMSEQVVRKITKICRRKTIIIVTSVSIGGFCFILALSFILFHLQRKRAREMQNRENVINMLRMGEGRYKFLVFLVYSSENENFVDTNIKDQLNENLQLMTGIDRDLVCTGDVNFRPGFYIHNETYDLLNEASVVIAIVSDAFNESVSCQNEIDKAYMNETPVILMLIEEIDKNKMSPVMTELYDKNVRVLWTVDDGEYRMKTTWDNVCTSVLELIK